MFEVSIFFQCETAERPASNPSKKPSSVSPRGVLIDIPVIAMRSFFNKVNLHHSECTNGVILRDLTRTRSRVVVQLECGCCYIEFFSGADLVQKCRMMNAHEANILRLFIPRNLHRTFAGEMKQAQSELRHRLNQKDSRINGMTGKVCRKYRVCRPNEPFSQQPR